MSMGQTATLATGKLGSTWLPVLVLPRCSAALARFCRALCVLILLCGLAGPAAALSAADLPASPPANHVLDQAGLLSRAGVGDVSRELDAIRANGVDATWVSIPRLDYDLTLNQFGQQLLDRWQSVDADQLLLLIDGQTSGTAVVASPALVDRLGSDLLRSTARTTMAQPLREGNRYRQSSLDAIARLSAVAAGLEDPGEPLMAHNPVAMARVPSREQTLSSNATTWIVVLLVVGTIVPMLTWWVFSR